MEVTITQLDPVTKRYIAQLTIVEGEKTYSYSCEGTWHPEDAKMVADALYDQYKLATAKQVEIDELKASMITSISAEVSKLGVK